MRLGKSGTKVSRLIRGCLSYGGKGWEERMINDREEVDEHIEYALVPRIVSVFFRFSIQRSFDDGMQTFDTAGVSRKIPYFGDGQYWELV